MIDHWSYAHNLVVMKVKPEKKFRPERDLNPWPLQYRFSALPTELSSQLGTGQATWEQLPDGLIAQLVEFWTGIAAVSYGFESCSGLNFFQA